MSTVSRKKELLP